MLKSVLSIGSALILSAVVANASDLPMKKSSAAPASAAASASNWTGGYVGIVGGYGKGSADINPSLVTLEFFGADTFETMNLDG